MSGRSFITDLRHCWVLIVFLLLAGNMSAQEIMIKDYFGHTAQDGETIISICQKYHITIDELLDYNPDMKKAKYKLKKGHYVKIPNFATRGLRYYEGYGYEINYEKAVECFKRAAEQGWGDSKFEYAFGSCYYYGRGVAQDYAQAVSWFRKAADDNHFDAIYKLGLCYKNGWGVNKDNAEATKWFKKVIEDIESYRVFNSDDKVDNTIGYVYYSGLQDYAQAVRWFRKAAEQGNAEAQCRLGICYKFGLGVTQDYAQAISWFRKAADQGNASAQNNLGWMYYEGKHFEQDYHKAYDYFKMAADRGNIYAVGNLGMMYYYGQYVQKDNKKAFDLLKKASESDNPPGDAMRVLSACYRYGVGTTIDNEKAEYWLEKSAEYGDDQAKMVLENEKELK